MTVPTRTLWAAALGFGISLPLAAQEPARPGADKVPSAPAAAPGAGTPVSANQKAADAVVNQLLSSEKLRGFKIDVVFNDGVVEVRGNVAEKDQRDEAIRLIKTVAGVQRIRDGLVVYNMPVTQVQAAMPAVPAMQDVPMPRRADAPPAGAMPVPPAGAYPGPQAGGYAGPQEPVPIYSAGGPGAYSMAPPNMPPYAWPTYAPYNNYSRVAYPTQYPYNAFPYIGPPYPFPKVPLGWRSVKLEWEDGHWWFGKTATCHDYWRLRYW